MDKLHRDLDTSFHPLTLKFRDPTIERAYIYEHNRRKLGPLRVAIVIFVALIFIQAGIGYFTTVDDTPERYQAWLASLPKRGASVAIMIFAYWITRQPIMIRHGQRIVGLGIVALYFIFVLSSDSFQHWMMLTTTRFNFSLMLIATATGLLFRNGALLTLLLGFGFLPYIVMWADKVGPPLVLVTATAFTVSWLSYTVERSRREAWASARELRDEKALTERLLLSVLPPTIAHRMRGGETLIADSHDEATVVFADIVNFTPLSASMPAEDLVEILDDIFAAFDDIADRYDLEKIKTIGDAYMMAAGLPSGRSADPTHALDAALEMRESLRDVASRRGIDIAMRAGVHIGPVVAGVIGRSKFVYDLWGDSVNIASRMESTAPNGEIQVTEIVHERLGNRYRMTPRGEVEVKGKGAMRTWLLASPAEEIAGDDAQSGEQSGERSGEIIPFEAKAAS